MSLMKALLAFAFEITKSIILLSIYILTMALIKSIFGYTTEVISVTILCIGLLMGIIPVI